MYPLITDAIHRIITRLSTVEKFVNGNHVLLIYYLIIFLFFLIDTYLRRHMHRIITDKDKEVDDNIIRVYEIYQKHGFIVVNLILYIICIGLSIYGEGFDFDFIVTITLTFIIFTLLMKAFLKIFINEDSYKSGMFARYLNVICYMILVNYFAFFVPFIRKPNLLIAYFGLVIGLLICIYIMIQAIFNPEILRRNTDSKDEYSEAFGILKGMLGVVVCILALEYMMVYSCFVTNPGFYSASEGRFLNGWDMFYYLIISFSTIGYGDIYPIRFDGMFFSEFTAIVIGLSSMFTTGCFVAAVISTANSIAQATKKKELAKEKKNKKKASKKSKTEEEKINQTVQKEKT